jgi:hypothetical protein
MKYKLDHNEIDIRPEKNWLRITTNSGVNLPLHNQTIEETLKIIEKNYITVKNYYQLKVGNKISEIDLEKVSLGIVISYFQMYNLWRLSYKREKNRDLTFIKKDFEHPYTNHRILEYFKKAYPDNYSEKCEIMMDLTKEEFREFEIYKEKFDNR